MIKKMVPVLATVLLVVALLIVGCAKPEPDPAPAPGPTPASAPAPELPSIKIGVLYPVTGPTAMVGQFMVLATKFAFEEAGYAVAGRKIEIVVEDTANMANVATDKARKLIEHDDVDLIIGPLTTITTEAVAPYISRMGVPQISASPNELKMTEYEWFFMVGGSKRQTVYPMGLYAYDKLGFRKITVLSVDNVSGRTFVGAFIEAFKSRGGEIIQEQYTPFPCQDFAPYLVNLKDADAVVAWFEGAEAIRFHIQFNEFGIRKRMPLQPAYFGAFVQSFLLRNMPPPAANAMIGEYNLSYYTYLLETDAGKHFAETFKNKFGYYPDDVHATPYLAVQVALKTLEATGGDTTPEKIKQAILGLDFESCEGRIRFDPATKCSYRDAYICRIDKINDDFVMVPVYTFEDVPPTGL